MKKYYISIFIMFKLFFFNNRSLLDGWFVRFSIEFVSINQSACVVMYCSVVFGYRTGRFCVVVL